MRTPFLFLVFVGSLLAGCNRHPDYVLIRGSETVLPVAWKLADRFTELDTMPDLSAIGGGSGSGIKALMADSTDIAMSSRAIKAHELRKLKEQGKQLQEVALGLDALAIIVHKNNPLDSLTPEQVRAIFTGQVRSWESVGGAADKIKAYHREKTSGTYDFFTETVLGNAQPAPLPEVVMNEQLLDKVMADQGSIAYIGIAYVDTALVKPLRIVNEKGLAVAPAPEAITSGAYPWTRKLFFYYTQTSNPKIRRTVAYLLSPEGQRLVQRVGYLPIQPTKAS
jgi:phosphate transport system substrate-binding protein